MPTSPAATGLAVTGSAIGLVPFVQWLLKTFGAPAMTADEAMGLIAVLALAGHGFIKLANGVAAWWMAKQASRREVWTPEQRAQVAPPTT